ncbi:MAG: hypothetical protein AAGA48_11255 [Myxococcota bacterium]
MITEIQLRGPNGVTRMARASVTTYATRDRLLRATAWAFGGVGVGGLSILMPGLHLVATWAAPLIGLAIGFGAGAMRHWVTEIDGACPQCDNPLRHQGPGPIWQQTPTITCPHCDTAVAVELVG